MTTATARRLWMGATFALLAAFPAAAQNFDTSGNGTVKGAYFVRQVLTLTDTNTSAITRGVSLTGVMTFDGNGNYSFAGQMTDSQAGTSAQAYSTTGTYGVSSGGLIQIQNPIDNTDQEYGGVGALGPSAIVASATEGNYDDLFIAIPATTGATNASVQGTYRVGFIDFSQGNASQTRGGYYNLLSSGSGSFGTVVINGGVSSQSATTNQSFAGVTYSISNANGSGTLTFPTASTPATAFVSGAKTFYVSADGNLVLGGSPGGYDILFGVKAPSGTVTASTYQGTYFTAAIENDTTNVASGNNGIDSFYGSTLALGEGDLILHDRLVSYNSTAFDLTSDGGYSLDSTGLNYDGFYENMLGVNGQALVQVAAAPFYSLTVSLRAKQATAGSVFVDPWKIYNAGSFAPITNSIAPGEYVSLFGSGLSSATLLAQSLPFLKSLGGVTVTVNGVQAAIGYVSPTQINFLVPYSLDPSSVFFATIQVTNNGTASNAVTLYSNFTSPGVFTLTNSGGSFAPGIGPAAVLHADYSLVTASHPAAAGETLQLYVTGLGAVTPAVADGAAAPSSKLSTTNETIFVDVQDLNANYYAATVSFSGLAPGYVGLYQVNFVVPTGIPTGLNYVNVGTTEAYTTEAKLYIK